MYAFQALSWTCPSKLKLEKTETYRLSTHPKSLGQHFFKVAVLTVLQENSTLFHHAAGI